MQISKTEQIGEIPGLRLIEYKSFSDSRGSFAEVWNQADFEALNLPFLNPKQANVAVSEKKGVTRGLHAEPWDKLIWVTKGKVFCVWLDLREGKSYGRTETKVIQPGTAVWIPRGVANGYQTIENETIYNYLTNGIWRPNTDYLSVNLGSAKRISWPISLDRAIVSEKDLGAPFASRETIADNSRFVIFGSDGRLGRALSSSIPNAQKLTGREIRGLSYEELARLVPRGSFLINCVGMTNVDLAESPEGFRDATAANNFWVSDLASVANETDSTLIHFSSDYVFNGSKDSPYSENDPLLPISKYGLSKALGDYAAQRANKLFLFRISWLLDQEQFDFVPQIVRRLQAGSGLRVVNDQIGRPTFPQDIVEAVDHVAKTSPPYGTYNLTGKGEKTSWLKLALEIATILDLDANLITPVAASEYFQGQEFYAERPKNSVLDTSKLNATGFSSSENWKERLASLVKDVLTN